MSTTYIKAKLAIATGRPATLDSSGYSALTWSEAAEGTVSIGVIGDTSETVVVPDLSTGRNTTLKGAVTGDTFNIALSRKIVAASGQLIAAQAAFKAACDAQNDAEYSIRITEQNGIIHYVTGVCMNWKANEQSTTAYAGFTFDVAANTAPLDIYPAP